MIIVILYYELNIRNMVESKDRPYSESLNQSL